MGREGARAELRARRAPLRALFLGHDVRAELTRAAKRAVKLAPDPGAAASVAGDGDLDAGRDMSYGIRGACRPKDAVRTRLQTRAAL